MIRTHLIESESPWTELRLGVRFPGMSEDSVRAVRDRADAAMRSACLPAGVSTTFLDLGASVSHRIWASGSVLSASVVLARTVLEVAGILAPIHIEMVRACREQRGAEPTVAPTSYIVIGAEPTIARQCADRIESRILGRGGEHEPR